MRTRWITSLLLALVLAACGGSSQLADEADTAADAPATSEAVDGAEADDAAMDDDMGHDDSAMADDGEMAHDEEMGHDESAMADGETAHDDGTMDHAASGSDEPAELTVNVIMTEFAYELDRTEVPVGVPVRFVFDNQGVIPHEAIFGDVHIQDEHEEAMAAGGGHDDAHGEGHHGMIPSITLEAAEVGDVVVTFDEVGETLIGCHIPGHYTAGMVATLTVVAS